MSVLFKLNSGDFIKGLITAVLTAVVPVLIEALKNGADLYAYDWMFVGKLALASGVGYIFKNFLTDKDGKVLGFSATK